MIAEKHVFGPFTQEVRATASRGDLEIYEINHYRPSYVAQIYFNDPAVDETNATEDRESYAGGFAIFGHEACVGDEGHCEVHEAASRFDDRPSHPLTRAFKRIVVTDALKRLPSSGELTVTIIATADPKASVDYDGPLFEIGGMQIAVFD